MRPSVRFEVVCFAGSLSALKAAVDNGASCVYSGLRDATNACNAIVALFDEARKRTLTPVEALRRMQPLMPEQGCNGYWHGRPGMEQIIQTASA